MKNFTIAIISLALLGVLGGCMHHGGGHVSATYSYPYYFSYPWTYPWGFFSFGYNYYYPYRDHKHRHPPHDFRPPGIYKKRDDQRPPDQHLRQNEDIPRGRPQLQKDRPRHRGRN